MGPSARAPLPVPVFAAAAGLLLLGVGWLLLALLLILVGSVIGSRLGLLGSLAVGLAPAGVTMWIALGLFRGSRVAHAIATGASSLLLVWAVATIAVRLLQQGTVGPIDATVTLVTAAVVACLLSSWRWFWRSHAGVTP